MRRRGKSTGGTETGPPKIKSVVRIDAKYAADDKKINWAASVALREIRDVVRDGHPDWTVLAKDVRLVEVDLEQWPGQALFLFEGAPTRIPVKRRRR